MSTRIEASCESRSEPPSPGKALCHARTTSSSRPRGTSAVIPQGEAVSARAVNIIIGRGQADLQIPSPAVSRRHATVNGTADALTLCDLGSSNGSSINGVPCLEGENLYFEPGDVLVLGNARFTLRITSDGEEA